MLDPRPGLCWRVPSDLPMNHKRTLLIPTASHGMKVGRCDNSFQVDSSQCVQHSHEFDQKVDTILRRNWQCSAAQLSDSEDLYVLI